MAILLKILDNLGKFTLNNHPRVRTNALERHHKQNEQHITHRLPWTKHRKGGKRIKGIWWVVKLFIYNATVKYFSSIYEGFHEFRYNWSRILKVLFCAIRWIKNTQMWVSSNNILSEETPTFYFLLFFLPLDPCFWSYFDDTPFLFKLLV